MNTIANVMIFQSDSLSASMACSAVDKMRELKDGRFTLTLLGQLENASEYVALGSQQLLITGSYDGAVGNIPKILSELRAVNPELICAGYSTEPMELPGLLDATIRKERLGDTLDLLATVRKFLAGEIKRACPAVSAE